jgi:hypothetical protein
VEEERKREEGGEEIDEDEAVVGRWRQRQAVTGGAGGEGRETFVFSRRKSSAGSMAALELVDSSSSKAEMVDET